MTTQETLRAKTLIELFDELEMALWRKIGNTWECDQAARVEKFLSQFADQREEIATLRQQLAALSDPPTTPPHETRPIGTCDMCGTICETCCADNPAPPQETGDEKTP